MLPITATPSAAPNRRVASFTADPTPAFSIGTAPRIASVAGAVMRPSPPPAMTICAAISKYDVVAVTVEIQSIPTPNRPRPAATTALLPTLTANRVPTTAAIAIDTATGTRRTPVPSGE